MCAFKRTNMDANALFSNGVINVALVAPPELLRHASNILAGVSNSQPPTWTVRVELADLSDARPVWSATQLIYEEFDEPWLVDPKGADFSVRTGTEISLDPSNREVVVRASSLQSAFVESYRVARHLLVWSLWQIGAVKRDFTATGPNQLWVTDLRSRLARSRSARWRLASRCGGREGGCRAGIAAPH